MLMMVLMKLFLLFLCLCVGAASSGKVSPSNSLLKGGAVSTENTEPTLSQSCEVRDVVIIGSGPSGCTAAIYAGRALLRPLVIAGYAAGGQLMLTSDVENFPGYREPVTGPEMMDDLKVQAMRFGAEFWQTNVQTVDFSSRPFKITTANCSVFANAIIISTGAEALWLNAKDEESFKGKGISTCATCDGYMFRNKPVVVIGGGDSAMEEASFLTRFASSVTVVHRRATFRASKVMLERAKKNNKITFLTNKKVIHWFGKEKDILSGLRICDADSGEGQEDIYCDGAFIAIGHRPNTKFLEGQLALDDNGYILLSKNTMTSVPGVFACGDVVDTRYRQAITAAGSGCQAAIDVERYLEDEH